MRIIHTFQCDIPLGLCGLCQSTRLALELKTNYTVLSHNVVRKQPISINLHFLHFGISMVLMFTFKWTVCTLTLFNLSELCRVFSG